MIRTTFWLTPLVLIVGTSAFADVQTIDFQSPPVTSELLVSPYVVDGVEFSTPTAVGPYLFRQGEYCGDPNGTNQMLGGHSISWSTMGVTIRAVLPTAPAPPVYYVRADVRSQAFYWGVYLALYNASGDVIGGVSSPDGVPTDPFCVPNVIHPLEATATEPIASVEFGYYLQSGWDCTGFGCSSEVTIDNFTFGDIAVPVLRTSWGQLKTVYR